MKIAVWQKRPISGPPLRAIEGLAQCLETLRGQQVDLLVCPELWSTGYFAADAIRAFAEPAEGDTAAAVGRLAAQAGMAVIYGYPERDSGTAQIYNSARLIDGKGAPAANYRKLHLWSAYERALFTPGEARMVPVTCAGWRIGLTICYDTEFPETVRDLALNGAELIVAPTALVAGAAQVHDLIVPTRAIESQVFLAFCNWCGADGGQRFAGSSCVVDPNGRKIAAAADEETVLVAVIDKTILSEARTRTPYLRDLRVDLFKDR